MRVSKKFTLISVITLPNVHQTEKYLTDKSNTPIYCICVIFHNQSEIPYDDWQQ